MLLMPPGSAKSTYGSVVYPSYYLGKNAGRRIILGSYGVDLARKMGRRTRSIINQPRYRQIMGGVELSKESAAADQFVLSNGSEYMASGLLAGITGNRAHGCIVDDPIAGRAEANSEPIRERTWEAYRDDLVTRLLPGGWIVMILTHWHEEDPAGKILPDTWKGESGMIRCRDGMDWNVICLAAKCENHTDPLKREIGEYLWPEWFDARHWAQFESHPMTWASLFQQRPRPLEGAYFKEEQLLVDDKPVDWPYRIDLVFAIIDTAMKTGKSHDGTGVAFFGLARHKQVAFPLYVLDWDIVQVEAGMLEEWLPSVFQRLEELARITSALYGSVGAFIEDKSSGTVLLQQVANHNEQEDDVWQAQAIDSKLTAMGKKERAFNAEPYVAAGDVKIVEHAYHKLVTYKGSLRNHFLSQVCGFSIDSGDRDPDDLLDTFTYGIALSIGNSEGF
jgi:hypothetical protein